MYFGMLTEGIIFYILCFGLIPLLAIGSIFSSSPYKPSRFWAAFDIIAIFVVLYLTGLFNVLTFASINWAEILIGFGAYLFFAFPYTRYITWRDFLAKEYEDHQSYYEKKGIPIDITEYKAEFMGMMAWWPLHFINKIIDKFILGFFETLQEYLFTPLWNMFKKALQEDSQAMFDKINKQ